MTGQPNLAGGRATVDTFRRSEHDGSRRRSLRRALALTRLVDRGYTTPAMRILTSALLAAFVLTLPLSVIAAPSLQPTIDIKTLALTTGDLPRGFARCRIGPSPRSAPDGVAVYDVTYARERTAENLAACAFEVRSGVARTAQVEDAVLQLESTKEAFLGEGWAATGVPPLGDEALGLTQTTDGEGGKVVHYSYLFRKGAYILMVGITRPARGHEAGGRGLAGDHRLRPPRQGAPGRCTGARERAELDRVDHAPGQQQQRPARR